MFTNCQLKCLQLYDCEAFTSLQLWNVYKLVWCIYVCVIVGHFIYFDGNGANYINYTATPVARTENHCLSFWYFMSGYVGSLTVYVMDSSGKRLAVWYRNDDHGSTWLQAEVDIPAGAFPLKEVKGLWRDRNVYRLQYLTTLSQQWWEWWWLYSGTLILFTRYFNFFTRVLEFVYIT